MSKRITVLSWLSGLSTKSMTESGLTCRFARAVTVGSTEIPVISCPVECVKHCHWICTSLRVDKDTSVSEGLVVVIKDTSFIKAVKFNINTSALAVIQLDCTRWASVGADAGAVYKIGQSLWSSIARECGAFTLTGCWVDLSAWFVANSTGWALASASSICSIELCLVGVRDITARWSIESEVITAGADTSLSSDRESSLTCPDSS